MQIDDDTVVAMPFGLAVSSTGYAVSGPNRWKHVNKFGYSTDISETISQPVWTGTGGAAAVAYPWPSTTFKPEIVSASTRDHESVGTSTGAQTVTVEGLAGDWTTKTETIGMLGTTPSTLTTGWRRINRMYVATAGASNTNAGILSLRVAGGGSTYAHIRAGDAQTLQAIYSVPEPYTAHLMEWHLGIAGTTAAGPAAEDANATFWARTSTNGAFRAQEVQPVERAQSINRQYAIPKSFPSKSDLYIGVQANSSEKNVSGTFTLVLEPTS